jgi:TatD DNase family protein
MTIPLLDFHVHDAADRPGVLAVRNRFPGMPLPSDGPFTVGLHPWHVDVARLDTDLAAITQEIRHPSCLAVGECGLDPLCETPRADQERAFAAQVVLATAANRPMVIHCVRAWPEVIAARTEGRPDRPWIVHGFRGKADLARDLVRHGFMLSFGPALLAAPTLRDALAAIPPDRFFLETDDAPADLPALYAEAAAVHRLSSEALAQQLLANLATLAQPRAKEDR